MLFWTRAILCIGTVTVLAVQRLPEAKPHALPAAPRAPVSSLMGEACRARPDLCAAAVTRGLGMVAPGAAGTLVHDALSSRASDGGGHRIASRMAADMAAAVAAMPMPIPRPNAAQLRP